LGSVRTVRVERIPSVAVDAISREETWREDIDAERRVGRITVASGCDCGPGANLDRLHLHVNDFS